MAWARRTFFLALALFVCLALFVGWRAHERLDAYDQHAADMAEWRRSMETYQANAAADEAARAKQAATLERLVVATERLEEALRKQ